MPHVSDIDDASGISAHHMFLSNCGVPGGFSSGGTREFGSRTRLC
jgi:hypothetical protein